jgi:membrane-associated phospholipid phosphatase
VPRIPEIDFINVILITTILYDNSAANLTTPLINNTAIWAKFKYYFWHMDFLLHWDYELFHWINYTMYSELWADIMAVLRNRYVWVPLYVTIITWIITRYDVRSAYFLVIYLLLGVMITDMLSSQVFKKEIQRVRPCNEQNLELPVYTNAPCRYSYSFPSSHAANHFGIATLLIGLFDKFKSLPWKVVLFVWAGIISFAQIYVGLHYPLDIIGGALLGILVTRLFLSLLTKIGPTDVFNAHHRRGLGTK